MKASVSLGDKKRGSGALLIGSWIKVKIEQKKFRRTQKLVKEQRSTQDCLKPNGKGVSRRRGRGQRALRGI